MATKQKINYLEIIPNTFDTTLMLKVTILLVIAKFIILIEIIYLNSLS
jgi:hypothetical protein